MGGGAGRREKALGDAGSSQPLSGATEALVAPFSTLLGLLGPLKMFEGEGKIPEHR